MIDSIAGFLVNLGLAFYNFGYAVTHPGLWIDWSDNQAIMRFVYFGASKEFLFVVLAAFIILTGLGIWRPKIMWGSVRSFEFIGNTIGRLFAWAGLVMVIQQILVIALERIFHAAEISVGPFGYTFTRDLGWFGEELKLYNAMVICLCGGYTFIQGSHIRVDLLYARASFRAKKVIDMLGSLVFMLPAMTLVWMYAWFFMWRHLIVPKPSPSDSLESLLMKARSFRWNVETVGYSPNGFDAYFLFKVLLVAFTGLVFLQAIAFFYRSLLEYREGPESEGRYADIDNVSQAALAGPA